MKFLALIVCLITAHLVFSQSQVDYRAYQTPVQNQVDRGTCTAFGIAALLELQPGVPANVSEQYLYGALKHAQPNKNYAEGDQLINYKQSLEQFGFIHEEQLPYNPSKIDWESAETEFVRMIQGAQIGKVGLLLKSMGTRYNVHPLSIQHFDAEESTDPTVLKNLLHNGNMGVAVSYVNLHVPTWSEANFTAESPLEPTVIVQLGDTILDYKEAKGKYTDGDLLTDILDEKLPATWKDPYFVHPVTKDSISNYGGHAVTVVGFNDKGFIFKNSWGEEWGENGYGYLSFDAHRLMVLEMLTIQSVRFKNSQQLSPVNAFTDVRLKSTRFTRDGQEQLEFSLFEVGEENTPNIERATYTLIDNMGNTINTLRANNYNTATGQRFAGITCVANAQHGTGNLPTDFYFGRDGMTVEVTMEGGGKKITKTFLDVQFATNEYDAASISDLLKN